MLMTLHLALILCLLFHTPFRVIACRLKFLNYDHLAFQRLGIVISWVFSPITASIALLELFTSCCLLAATSMYFLTSILSSLVTT